MKKIITLLLALCMVMSMSVPAFSVETETYYAESYSYSNPIYGEVADEEFEDIPVASVFSDSEYLNYEDAVLLFRDALEARAPSFVLKVTTDEINIVLETDENGKIVTDAEGYAVIKSGGDTARCF